MEKPLEQRLKDLCDEQPFHIGFSFINLQTGGFFNRFGDEIVPSASTRKIFILACVLADIKAGKLNLTDHFFIQKKYQDNNSGIFHYFDPNACVISLHDALVAMVAISDNACTGGIVEMIGLDRLNKYITSLGFNQTLLRYGNLSASAHTPARVETTNVTTPNEAAAMIHWFLKGSIDEKEAVHIGLDSELCNLALKILLMQQINYRLPFHLPVEARVAHKTGTRSNAYNDVGIVYKGEHPLFILAVYTFEVPEMIENMPGKYVASDLIARLCRSCYDSFEDVS
ncbi:MAG: class A beta-lactamase-related serine hydrolase [Candidatus Pacebacteria bacterium]|jgi:beta-lactamase class A|nr:class A beta-lactamase-related serine hydrolase [Candidatus Paceibacterota bacterium]